MRQPVTSHILHWGFLLSAAFGVLLLGGCNAGSELERLAEARRAEARRKAEEAEDAASRREAGLTQQAADRETKRRADEARRKEDVLKKLQGDVAELVKLPKQEPAAPLPRLRGKALVWERTGDDTNQCWTAIQGRLPEFFQGRPGEEELALFIVTKRNSVQVAEYRAFRNPLQQGFADPFPEAPRRPENSPVLAVGYRVDVEIRVVQWPAGTVLGDYTVRGNEPPETISVAPDQGSVTGEYLVPVANWVKGWF